MSLEPSPDLNEAGLSAYNYVKSVLAPDKFILRHDHVIRYAKAAQIEDAAYKEWLALGSPVTALGGSTGKVRIREVTLETWMDASRTAARYLAELEIITNKSVGGRPPNTKNTKSPSKITRKEA